MDKPKIKMKCEADFKKCKNEAKWKMTAFGCQAKLLVCDLHKKKYDFKNNPLMQTIEKIT